MHALEKPCRVRKFIYVPSSVSQHQRWMRLMSHCRSMAYSWASILLHVNCSSSYGRSSSERSFMHVATMQMWRTKDRMRRLVNCWPCNEWMNESMRSSPDEGGSVDRCNEYAMNEAIYAMNTEIECVSAFETKSSSMEQHGSNYCSVHVPVYATLQLAYPGRPLLYL